MPALIALENNKIQPLKQIGEICVTTIRDKHPDSIFFCILKTFTLGGLTEIKNNGIMHLNSSEGKYEFAHRYTNLHHDFELGPMI